MSEQHGGGGADPQSLVEALQIENARLRARLEQQLRAQRELATGLGATQQLGAIVRTSVEHAVALSGGDSGGVYLQSEPGGALELAGHLGLTPAFLVARGQLPLEHPFIQRIFEGGISYLTLADHGDLQDEHDRAEGLTSCVHLPIRHGTSVIGALFISSHSRPALEQGSAGALDLLARQLGAAIARSRAKAEQAMLAKVVESSIVGIGLADHQGVATYVNPALARMWGFPSAEHAVGSSVLDWWDDRAAAQAVLDRTFLEGSVTDELLARRADGSTFPAVGTACLIRSVDGVPSHVAGSFIDVTEIHRGQDALRQVRLADAINGLLLRALDGQREQELGCACVQVALELTGAVLGVLATVDTRGEIEATFAQGPEARDRTEPATCWRATGQGSLQGLWTFALRQPAPFFSNDPSAPPSSLVVPEGHPPIDNLLFVPMPRDGQIVAILALANCPGGFEEGHVTAAATLAPVILQVLDYQRSERARFESERRVREQDAQLRQGQKLEAIGRLADGVAHDFNNLLAVVSLFGQSLLADLEPDSELADDARAIVDAVDRGADLTRQLLAFGRRAVLQPVHQQAGALVLQMETMIRRLLGDDVELVVEAAPTEGWIHADPGEVGQVLMNLAVNARDAMPDGGSLRIVVVDSVRPDPSMVPGLPEGEYVELRVEDTGVGMGPEQLEHLFEPFYTTKEKGKGTGLGLATVYGIVRQTGGTVVVESTPGQGTTFRILMPRVQACQPDAARPEPPPDIATGQETLLVAEDDPQVRRGTVRTLRQAGYFVLEAANAGEALLIAEQHLGVIHALVSDVDMPRISGPRLARRLQLARRDMKVMFVTGHGGERLDGEELAVDGALLLAKPFTVQQLTQSVRSLLDG